MEHGRAVEGALPVEAAFVLRHRPGGFAKAPVADRLFGKDAVAVAREAGGGKAWRETEQAEARSSCDAEPMAPGADSRGKIRHGGRFLGGGEFPSSSFIRAAPSGSCEHILHFHREC
jgi:hypothetical protein